MTRYKIAESVVYRHPCDCPSASRPLEPGEEAKHRFEVDGAPFPWPISEDGVRFTRFREDLFAVHVTLYPGVSSGFEVIRVHTDDGLVPHLSLGGVAFPWFITEQGFDMHVGRTSMSTVKLAFLAESLDVDCDVTDE